MPTDFAPHNMVSNTDVAPSVISASSFFSGGLAPWKAFDGNTASYWIGTGSGTDWLQLDKGFGPAILISYDIRVNVIPEPNRAPKNWTMLGSTDGTTWNTLDTRTNETGWTSGQVRSYTCATATTAYRYFRINITANNGDANYTQIAELYLYKATQTPTAGGTHSAWRILIPGVVSGTGGCAVGELEFYDSTGTLLTTGGTPLCSTEDVFSSHLAGDAFDGNQGTFWGTNVNPSVATQWLGYYLSSPAAVINVTIRNRDGWNYQAPKGFSIQYSDDGYTWATISDFKSTYSPVWRSDQNNDQYWGVYATMPPPGYYLSYRAYLTTVTSGTSVECLDLSFRAVAGGTNLVVATSAGAGINGTAIDDTGTAFAAYPTYAFDTGAAVWASGVPGWIGYAFRTPKQVLQVSYTYGTNVPPRPTAGVIQGSNDGGETWVTLANMSFPLTAICNPAAPPATTKKGNYIYTR